jgi:hypothetical protein
MRRLLATILLLGVLTGCAASGSDDFPSFPAFSASGAPAGQNTDPAAVLARNIEAAHSACGGCGGTLDLDDDTKDKLIDELVDEHSKHTNGPALTRANAEVALYGPAGATPKLAGQGNPPPDVSFRDAAGNEVYRREVKTFNGTPKQFSNTMSTYASKISYRGELLIQVPAGTDPKRLMDAFWAARGNETALAKFADVYAAFRDPEGKALGLWMFGARGMGVPGV